MKFTGERYVPTEQGKLRLEHYHRYATVSELAPGKQVLDVACGEGYGTSMIASVARQHDLPAWRQTRSAMVSDDERSTCRCHGSASPSTNRSNSRTGSSRSSSDRSQSLSMGDGQAATAGEV